MSRFQLTIDCTDPGRLVRFWSAALGYRIEDPPDGFETWNAYWRSVGVPAEELHEDRDSADSIVDPEGGGPRIWFQVVPAPKLVKNRLHLDLDASGGRDVPLQIRRQRVDADVDRLVGLGAGTVRVLDQDGVDHYGVTMADPEGNEFCVH